MAAKLAADDSKAFRRAVELLQAFNSQAPRLLDQNFAVAVAVLLHRAQPRSMRASGPQPLLRTPDGGKPASNHVLEVQICDRSYEKNAEFLPEGREGPIYKPFTHSFKNRSSSSHNNWRHSFAPQGGLGCDAPYGPEYLQSADYLNEPRYDCEFRDAATGHCHSPAGYPKVQTCFNPNKRGVPPGRDSKAQHRPKLLSRGVSENTKGYWYIEPTVEVLSELLASPEKRVPLYPFIVALYGGSPYFTQWGTEISPARFEADIGLGHERFSTLFDPDPTSPLNQQMISRGTKPARGSGRESPSSRRERSPSSLSKPVRYKPREEKKLAKQAEASPDPIKRARLLERAKRGHKRTLDALAALLEERGFELSEQLDGFDLLAISAQTSVLFEIKTWTPANLGSQIRHGWAQLLEYRFRNQASLPDPVQLCLVLDRRPPTGYWAWAFLAEELNIGIAWISKNGLSTHPSYRDPLGQL